MKYLPLLLLLCSCEALATLESLKVQVDQQGIRIETAIREGELNAEELDDLSSGALRMSHAIEDTQDSVAKALDASTEVAHGVLGGGPLGDAAGAVLAGVFGLNAYRSRTRRRDLKEAKEQA